MRARFVLSEIWVGLRRNLTMTLAVVVTVAVTLALFGFALLVRQTVGKMSYYYYGKLQVSVFLNANVTEDERTNLDQQLSSDPLVSQVAYESSAEALRRFRIEFAAEPQLVAVAEARPDALPESFRVELKNPTDANFAILQSQFAAAPGVQQIFNASALLKKVFSILNGIRDAAEVVAAVQVVACLLLIANTIRLAAFGRRRETGIMRLVGASNLYIQLPFLLEGVTSGLIGGGLACLVLVLAKRLLFDAALHPLFNQNLIPNLAWSEVAGNFPLLLVLGMAASGLAAFVTLRQYLRV
jgi:cell division transport system permease protein